MGENDISVDRRLKEDDLRRVLRRPVKSQQRDTRWSNRERETQIPMREDMRTHPHIHSLTLYHRDKREEEGG